MTNYTIGDFLIRVKNAALVEKKEIMVPETKEILAVAKTLKKLGYLAEVSKKDGNVVCSFTLKHKRPILMGLNLISKPGLRIYMSVSDLEKKKGPSVYILTTPKGVISSVEAKKIRVGGEVLAEVW